MGRKTLESFPGKKPLKTGLILCSPEIRTMLLRGVTLCGSVEEALELLKQYDSEGCFYHWRRNGLPSISSLL